MVQRSISQRVVGLAAACALMLSTAAQSVLACTGITLTAADGSIVFGRTLEWGSFDLMSRLEVVPRGHAYSTHMPDGKPGLSWQGRYGVVGIDAVGKDLIVEGMNEKGLAVGLFYHPGFAEYQTYDPAQAAQSMSPTDVGQYLLTNYATVGEVREAMAKIRVVAVVEPALGFAPPVHFIVTEPSGKAIVIEFLNAEMKVFDAPLGVITNAPSYDWHETNLRNYINLSPVALPGKKLEDLNFKPLGGGSGMIGLPGDFTPPSRFVRAVAFSKTARPTRPATRRCTRSSAFSTISTCRSARPKARARTGRWACAVRRSGPAPPTRAITSSTTIRSTIAGCEWSI
jgi:choloylglycine hydrolase